MTTQREQEQIKLIRDSLIEQRMKKEIIKEREVFKNLINKQPKTERKHRVDRLQEKFVSLWALQEEQERNND